MIAPQTVIHIYSLWYGNMPDIFTELLFSFYNFINFYCSPRLLRSSLTLFSCWFPRCVQSGTFLRTWTNACPSGSIFIPRHVAVKPACTINRIYFPSSPCFYQPHTRSRLGTGSRVNFLSDIPYHFSSSSSYYFVSSSSSLSSLYLILHYSSPKSPSLFKYMYSSESSS